MFYTGLLKELYTCYMKKDELVLQRKTQMEEYQKMVQKILGLPCHKNVIEFYKLFEKYNYSYNLESLDNPLKCDKIQEMINNKNRVIDSIQKLDICNDIDKVRDLLKIDSN
jgi:hypothetical protein